MERIAARSAAAAGADGPAGARPPVRGRRGPKRLLALRDDARLVTLVRAGDDAAFEVLYERHVAGLLGFCRHMLGSQEEAEDAVQQAFVSAHGAMRRGSREIAFKPWLYTIARNRCLSVLRARREQPAELDDISTAGLNEQVERRADLRELVADVQRLPEEQRTALVLSELGDLSHAEVAEVIGKEPKAIKGLVFRARAALAERRDARAADCGDIRLELASASGGTLRRGRLRYHLETCPGCVAYLEEVRRQRKLLGIALPVVPTLALKEGVLESVGIGVSGAAAGMAASASGGAGAVSGGGAAGAASVGGAAATGAAAVGGAATSGGALLGGAAVKLAVAGAILAGGAGVATEVVRDSGDKAPAPPAAQEGGPANGVPGTVGPGAGRDAGVGAPRGGPAVRALERRRGARGAVRRARGQRRAVERGGGRSAAGEPHGKALGRRADPAVRGGGKPTDRGQGGGPGRGEGKSAPPATSPPRRESSGGSSAPDRGGAPLGAPSGGGPAGVSPSTGPPRSRAPRSTTPPPAP